MIKKYFLLSSLMFSPFIFSQVGINTENPTTTLDVSVKKNGTTLDTNQTYGLQAPRLTRKELTSLTSTYGTNQKGALIYITDISEGDQVLQRAKIDAVGYYYFDGTLWQKISNGDSSTGIEPWNLLGTTAKATSNTDNIYQTGRILVGYPDLYTGVAAGATNSVVGQKLNVVDNLGVSRIGQAANMVIFNAGGGTWAAPTDTKKDNIIGNLLFEGYSDAKRAGADNFGLGRVGVAQVRAIATDDFSDNSVSSARLDLMTKANAETLTTKMTVLGNGNVGIGTLNPTQKLDIWGKMNLDTAYGDKTIKDILKINIGRDTYGYGNRGENNGILFETNSTVESGNVARINFGDTNLTTNEGTRYLSFSVGKKLNELLYMTDKNEGAVGIGTNAPSRKLDLYGKMYLNSVYGNKNGYNVLDINIGRDGYGYGNRTENNGIIIRSEGSEGGDVARINFGDTSTSTLNNTRYLSFSVGKTLNELLYITDANSGGVGIGTSNPTQKLDVAGNARITGNVTVDTNLTASKTITVPQVYNAALPTTGTFKNVVVNNNGVLYSKEVILYSTRADIANNATSSISVANGFYEVTVIGVNACGNRSLAKFNIGGYGNYWNIVGNYSGAAIIGNTNASEYAFSASPVTSNSTTVVTATHSSTGANCNGLGTNSGFNFTVTLDNTGATDTTGKLTLKNTSGATKLFSITATPI